MIHGVFVILWNPFDSLSMKLARIMHELTLPVDCEG